MATATKQYMPDYVVPPGWVLEERLEAQGISHAEFARRCGRSPKLISEIIAGKAPLEPETALQFEKVLGVDASIWLGIESDYQLNRARKAEAEVAAKSIEWAKDFPLQELVKRKCFPHPESDADAVSKLLVFFGVGSIEAWTTKYGELTNVAFRHSPSFKSNQVTLVTWLRLGELEAERQTCVDYSESRFKQATREIRDLTLKPANEAVRRAMALCNQAGVSLALVPPLPKTALSGAARWLSPRKAIIQLSMRHKTDDHLWFSFFHEAAHILLHSKKSIFVDGDGNDGTDIEIEANEWASNALVPQREWMHFVASLPRSEKAVRAFADQQGIAPGIVVGMLQHENHLPWTTHLNKLRVKLE